MGLESGTYVNDLVATNPLGTDLRKQGANHLRLIKSVLQNTFPSLSRAVRFDRIVSKSANYSVLATDDMATILCDPTGGAFTLTLPATGSLFAGWRVKVMKSVDDANPVYVAPDSGTINGVAKIRADVPFVIYEFLYTGSAWVRVKQPGEISAGVLEDYGGGTTPTGYALAYGQTLVRADHPEFFAARGETYGAGDGSTTFLAPDARGRALFGKNNMGGSGANRLTSAHSGIDGDTLGASGGAQTVTLIAGQLPIITPQGTLSGGTHDHLLFGELSTNLTIIGAGHVPAVTATYGDTNPYYQIAQAPGSHTRGKSGAPQNVTQPTFTGTAFGNNEAHQNVPPALVVNKMFRLC